MDTIYARMLAHLVQLARHPGSVDHARHVAKTLEACESGLWTGLTAAIRLQLGQAPTTAFAPPSPTKPH
jgi:hypothetical protein